MTEKKGTTKKTKIDRVPNKKEGVVSKMTCSLVCFSVCISSLYQKTIALQTPSPVATTSNYEMSKQKYETYYMKYSMKYSPVIGSY